MKTVSSSADQGSPQNLRQRLGTIDTVASFDSVPPAAPAGGGGTAGCLRYFGA